MQIKNGVIGHRGASAYAPENTFAAFNKAYELGCNWIEFDVMLSADGEPFIFHDDLLERTTNGKGELGLALSTYLKTLDAGFWFSELFQDEKIPHFKDCLDWLIQRDINANIEVKPFPGTSEETALIVLDCIKKVWPKDKLLPLISSFDLKVLEQCHSTAPCFPLGLLLEIWDEEWLYKAKQFNCFSIHMNEQALNNAHIKEIKKHNYPLYAYTVNIKERALELLAQGVDAVFSDYPDLLS